MTIAAPEPFGYKTSCDADSMQMSLGGPASLQIQDRPHPPGKAEAPMSRFSAAEVRAAVHSSRMAANRCRSLHTRQTADTAPKAATGAFPYFTKETSRCL